MRRTSRSQNARLFVKKVLKLFNAIVWDRRFGDKIYLQNVSVAVGGSLFELRKVFLRFSGGPEIDMSIEDMDRFVAAYLKIRGIDLPAELKKRKDRPIEADFEISKRQRRKALR